MARLIDMDELLNEFEALKNKAETLRDAICLDAVMAVIDTAPTIDAVPVVHGEWEEIRNAYDELEGWIHRECGREVQSKYNYCPNCGAKMDADD